MADKSTKRQFSFIDVFAGCGGLSLGLMKAGWAGLFAIEKDSFAFETLKHNLLDGPESTRFKWPTWLPKEPASINAILETYRTELGNLSGKVDMLVGGPPCQGFSSAGRRDPNDPRNQLVNAYLQLVAIVRPKIVLIENVRGITQDFDDDAKPDGKVNYAQWIIGCLSTEYVVSTRMVDTSAFGVPQRRQRFFIIAVKKELSSEAGKQPFDVIGDERLSFLNSKGILSTPVSASSAISDLEVGRNGVSPSRDSKNFEEIGYVAPLTPYQKLLNEGEDGKPSDTRLARHSLEIASRFQQIIEYCHEHKRLSVSMSSELNDNFGLKKKAIRVLDPHGPAPTITSMPDDLIHYSEPRTLTVRENARLQGFPDSFQFRGKYTTGGERRKREVPRFTQVANAVPPLVSEAFGGALKKYLEDALLRTPEQESSESPQKARDTRAVHA